MKLKAIANSWMNDSKRGCMVERKKGEEFDMDPSDEGEAIYSLLWRITIIDEKFIPLVGEYIGVHSTTYTNKDGNTRHISPGQSSNLDQETASRLLVGRFIKPADENQWTPRKLLGPVLKEDKVKRMFDEPEPAPKENWAKNYGVKSGRD